MADSSCSKKKSSCMRAGRITRNGYLNFLREYRRKHCNLTAVQIVRAGAKAWNRLSEAEKNCYASQGCNAKVHAPNRCKSRRKTSRSRSRTRRCGSKSRSRSRRGSRISRVCNRGACRSKSRPRTRSRSHSSCRPTRRSQSGCGR